MITTEANLPVATMKKLDRYLTARTQVYRFQSVGYLDKGGPVARIEIPFQIGFTPHGHWMNFDR